MTQIGTLTSSVSRGPSTSGDNLMAQFRSAFALAGLVGVLLGAFGKPASAVAAIDMSGVYVAVEFPCRYTFVQTDTSLTVSGPCGPQNAPLNLTGTIDPGTRRLRRDPGAPRTRTSGRKTDLLPFGTRGSTGLLRGAAVQRCSVATAIVAPRGHGEHSPADPLRSRRRAAKSRAVRPGAVKRPSGKHERRPR